MKNNTWFCCKTTKMHVKFWRRAILLIYLLIYSIGVIDWMIRGSNPGRGKWVSLLQKRPDWLWSPPSFIVNECRGRFPGVKWPRRYVGHPPSSSAELRMSGAMPSFREQIQLSKAIWSWELESHYLSSIQLFLLGLKWRLKYLIHEGWITHRS
jgi:hypothetical protein